jgi:hypothetical protein
MNRNSCITASKCWRCPPSSKGNGRSISSRAPKSKRSSGRPLQRLGSAGMASDQLIAFLEAL